MAAKKVLQMDNGYDPRAAFDFSYWPNIKEMVYFSDDFTSDFLSTYQDVFLTTIKLEERAKVVVCSMKAGHWSYVKAAAIERRILGTSNLINPSAFLELYDALKKEDFKNDVMHRVRAAECKDRAPEEVGTAIGAAMLIFTQLQSDVAAWTSTRRKELEIVISFLTVQIARIRERLASVHSKGAEVFRSVIEYNPPYEVQVLRECVVVVKQTMPLARWHVILESLYLGKN